MKRLLLLILFAVAGNAFASSVSVPFTAPVPKEGLVVQYNLSNNQRVFCNFSDFYKGWVQYQQYKSPGFGGGSDAQYFYFTNKGPTKMIDEQTDQVHVDVNGSFSVFNTFGDEFSAPVATCSYEPDPGK